MSTEDDRGTLMDPAVQIQLLADYERCECAGCRPPPPPPIPTPRRRGGHE